MGAKVGIMRRNLSKVGLRSLLFTIGLGACLLIMVALNNSRNSVPSTPQIKQPNNLNNFTSSQLSQSHRTIPKSIAPNSAKIDRGDVMSIAGLLTENLLSLLRNKGRHEFSKDLTLTDRVVQALKVAIPEEEIIKTHKGRGGVLKNIFFKTEYVDLSVDLNPAETENFKKSVLKDLEQELTGPEEYGNSLHQKDSICSRFSCNYRFERQVHGRRVLNEDLVISARNSDLISISGSIEPIPSAVASLTEPGLGESDALELVKRLTGSAPRKIEEIEFGVFAKNGQHLPAFKILAVESNGASSSIIVAAQTLAKLEHYQERSSLKNSSGINLKGELVNFNSREENGRRVLIDDTVISGQVVIMLDSTGLTSEDAMSASNYVAADSQSGPWNPSAVSVIGDIQRTVDYLRENVGYEYGDGFKRAPEEVVVFVDLAEENAFASALYNIMGFGKSAAVNYSMATDVIGHEVGHILNSRYGRLNYYKQSGAINEAYADFLGSIVEGRNWLIGEDADSVGRPIRNMQNPLDAGKGLPQPANVQSYVYMKADNGGVHVNSGIINRFFYLVSQGLSQENSGTSIGHLETFKLAFNVLPMLSSDSSFAQFYLTFLQAAGAMYGTDSVACRAVVDAGKQTGFDTSDRPGSANFSSPSRIPGALVYYLSENLLFGYDFMAQALNDSNGDYDPDSIIRIAPFSAFSPPAFTIFDSENFLGVYESFFGGLRGIYAVDGEEGEGEILSSAQLQEFGLSVADIIVTPDKQWLYLTFSDLPFIFERNISTGEISIIEPSLPSYGGTVYGGNIAAIDVINVSRSGNLLVFDFKVCPAASLESGSCYWSIGIHNRNTGDQVYPFAGLGAEYSIGNPSFANASDRYIAVDITSIENDISGVYVLNLGNGELSGVSSNRFADVAGTFYGRPSFSNDDGSLIFSVSSSLDRSFIYSVPLEDYKRKADSAAKNINPNITFFAQTAPFDSEVSTSRLVLDKSVMSFGSVVEQIGYSSSICLSNQGGSTVSITRVNLPQGFSFSSPVSDMPPGTEFCFRGAVSQADLPQGPFSNVASIFHDGENSPVLLSLTGTITIVDSDGDGVPDSSDVFPFDSTESADSDGDGIGNNSDEDDDGDGVLDSDESIIGTSPLNPDSDFDGVSDFLDVFPLDPTEARDFDGDGIGDNSDLDDDGDGVEDSVDAFPLDALEQLDTDGDGFGNNLDADDDGDALSDEEELSMGTDPLLADSDGDGLDDGVEVDRGLDPVLAGLGQARLGPNVPLALQVAGASFTLPSGGLGTVPSSAAAAALNITVVNPSAPGFITAWPCGLPRPLASNINFEAGSTIPNGVIASLGSDGAACLYSSVETDIVVDLAGWFDAEAYQGATPVRLVDTRDGTGAPLGLTNSAAPIQVPVASLPVTSALGSATAIPGDVGAVALNVTAVEPTDPGYITVWPCEAARPNASNLNFMPGDIIANGVIAPAGRNGVVCAFSSAPTHMIVDLAGWFPGDTFTGMTPTRLLDTRDGGGAKVPTGGVVEVETRRPGLATSSDAAALSLNVTVTEAEGPGYLTVWPCDVDRPNASNLNYVAGQTIANNVMTTIGASGKVCAFASAPTHVIVDIAGWVNGSGEKTTFSGVKPTRVGDTRTGQWLGSSTRDTDRDGVSDAEDIAPLDSSVGKKE